MPQSKKLTEKECHKKFAVNTFNETWNYLEKTELSKQEKEKMLELAYTSLDHWRKAGTNTNVERGEWLLARVYAVIKNGENALFHAEQCLKICKENNIKDWDIAFAYEAIARAYATLKQNKECKEYLNLAEEAGNSIKKKADKDLLFNDLKTIKCK